MEPFTSLVAANVAFVGSHFAMSHPLRAPLVRALGEKGFLGIYSLVSLATFGWIILAFRSVGAGKWPLWDGESAPLWIIASLLTILATALLLASLKGNPALPGTSPHTLAQARADGVYAVTRHPMMWAFALWALAHILVMPSARTGVTAGAIGFLALVGAHLQDRKKEALLGDVWKSWEAQTSYWPRLGKLGSISIGVWLAAIAGWLALTWAHIPLAFVPAGVWRWVG
jgi:uncharacterized membrane protein